VNYVGYKVDIQVRKAIPYEEVDTAMLRQALYRYSSPDDKIGDMVRCGELIRVRKGLYAVAPGYRQSSLSLEILANTLYGPSYISLEYALSWYGMIPERVSELTSVCLGRSRIFSTEVGNFSYCSIKKTAYTEGYGLTAISDGRSYLMATLEKALVDLVENRRNVSIRSRKEMRTRLLEDLRMDELTLLKLNVERVAHYASLYGSVKTNLLVSFLKHLNGGARSE
jgi:predicted transcriptional regulator of viral defense system